MSARPIICAFDATEPARLAAHTADGWPSSWTPSLELVYVLDEGALPALPREGAGADPVLREKLYRLQEHRARQQARRGLEEIAGELPGTQASY